MKKIIDCFVVLAFMISSQNYLSKVHILQIKKILCDRKLIFFLWKKVYMYKLWIQKSEEMFISLYYFLFYSQWVHVESPKYKMNLLFFLTNIGQKSFIMVISSCFNNHMYSIEC